MQMLAKTNAVLAARLFTGPHSRIILVLLALLLPGLSRAQAPDLTYSGPLTITSGGTYTGNFKSTDTSVPVIKIMTTDPVIIENCTLAGAGDLIDAKNGGVTLTVRNTRGYALTSGPAGSRYGRFLEVNSGHSVRIENNYMQGTTGISVYQWGGNGTAQQTLTIRYNKSLNIDGRLRGGGVYFANFIGMNQVRDLVGAEIAWNEVINEPNNSLVEDNISFYNSGGVANSPALLHDNYIQGAYPYPATATNYNGTGFIIDGDGTSNSSSYVKAYGNQVVSTSGAGINIAGGHDNQFYDNRVVNSGLLPDGTRINANWAGAAVFNAYNQPPSAFFNNSINNNTIGYYSAGGNLPYSNRQDTSPGACGPCSGNVSLPDRPLTLSDEQNERTLWQQKLQQNGITLGVGGSAATPPTTTTTTSPTPTTTPPATSGPQVSSYTLVNADTNADIQTLTSGTVLNLATLPTRNLNIRANTTAGTVGSVVFALGGAQVQNHTENVAPYALFSDNNGAYNPWTPAPGAYSLTARTYDGADGGGTAGTALAISFTVKDQVL
ncbi:MAG: hypothetical protein NVS3B25_08090 [Hymenobacter sp.]